MPEWDGARPAPLGVNVVPGDQETGSIIMKNRRRAFTLIECAVMVLVLGLLISVAVPMLGAARYQMRGLSSAQKLMNIGQGGMMYAQDNNNRVFNYSWRAGEYYVLPSGRIYHPSSDQEAASHQNMDILMRRTGRIEGEFKINSFTFRVPHRRFGHLVLLDYLNQPIDTDAYIDPSDGKQLVWASRPLEYGEGSGVPYANGLPGKGYDNDRNWELKAMRQRWAFASSYQSVPSAWQRDYPASRYIPVETTPHLFQAWGDIDLHSGRHFAEVLHPGNKVWMHEEFDRDRTQQLYFGYDEANADKLMFDGSVNNWASGAAAPSVVPERGYFHWEQAYVPLDRFPLPVGGLGDETLLSQRYRWTFAGLSGIDYGAFSFDRSSQLRD